VDRFEPLEAVCTQRIGTHRVQVHHAAVEFDGEPAGILGLALEGNRVFRLVLLGLRVLETPGKPYVIRQLSWYLRNPLQNFGKYVLGVGDRNYTVVGAAPVYATFWSDVDPVKTGWKISTIRFDWLRLPFVSYEDEHLIWYAGWQWSGFFGFKLHIKNSPIQFW
jgi:hypothetical protein